MAGRRYKAGTIFLDVAPSFDQVQDKIEDFVERKNGGINKALEKQGRAAGEAFAKGELEGREKGLKAQGKLVEKQASKAKAVNKAIISNNEEMWTQQVKNVVNAQKGETKAVERETRARTDLRRTEAEEAKNLQAQRNAAHAEAIKERDRRERDSAAQQKAIQKALLSDFSRQWKRAQKEQQTLLEQIQDGERARIAETEAAEKQLTQSYAREAEEREKIVSASGGRIGELIRKSVGGALDDLPAIKLSEATSENEKTLAKIRERLFTLKDYNIGVDIDVDGALAEIATLRTELATLERNKDGSIDINVGAALASLQAVDDRIDKVQRKAARPILMRIITKMSGLGNGGVGDGVTRGFLGLRGSGEDGANAFRIFNAMVLAVVAGLSLLGPLLAVGAAGLASIAGAAIAGAGALGVLALGFQGIVGAIQDQIKAEDDLGKKAATAAKTRANGARQIRDAKERLADAERNAARATEDAARQVSDAERAAADARENAADSIASAVETQRDAEQRLRDAQEDSARAQRDLNEARREAKRDIEDLAFSYDRAKLDEKEAAIAIAQAQERLNETRRRAARGDASYADVRSAELDVSQARLRAREATVRRRRAGADSAEAKRKGVEGSDQVISAKDQLEDARRAEADAGKAVQDAAKNVAKTRRDAARSVEDAERRVTDALRAQTRVAQDNARSIRDAKQGIVDAQQAAAESSEAMSSAAYDAQKSMSELTPEGRRFARFILGLRGGYRELRDLAQAGMLPGLEAGMRELSVYESGFKKFVTDMSKMWGDSFRSMGKQLTGPTWRSFFATMGKDGPKQAGLLNQALFNVLTTVAALADAFSPLTTDMLTWLEKATAGWADWAASLKGSPEFERFLGYVERTAPIVRDLFLSLGRALINIGVALAPFAEGLMKVLTHVFDFIAAMDPKVLGQILVAVIALVVGIQLMAGAMSLASGAVIALTNPFALLILAVAALSVWMIHLYQTNETARKYIDRMLDSLKGMATWLYENRKAVGTFIASVAGFVIFAKLAWTVALFVTRLRMIPGLAAKVGKALKLLGVAARFMFGPWGIAIAIVVAGLIYLWKTNEGFRNGVIAAWNGIKRAMSAVATWWTETAAPAMGRAFEWLGKNVVPVLVTALRWLGRAGVFALKLLTTYWTFAFKAIAAVAKWLWTSILKPVFTELNAWIKEIIAPAMRWLWAKVIRPAFSAIGRAAKAMWKDFLKPTFRFISYFIKTVLGPTFSWLWKKIISPVFRWIGSRISGTFTKVVLPVFRLIRSYLKNVLGPAFKWLWEKGAGPAFRKIGAIIAWVWKKSRPNFDKMKDGLDALRKAFIKARDGIGKIWEKVVDKIKNPLQTAMEWIDKHFLSKLRAVLKAIGAEDLAKAIPDLSGNKASGKRTVAQRAKVGSRTSGDQALAAGGRVQGPFRSATADNVLGIDYSGVPTAWVNPKEYVLPVRATERLTRLVGPSGMEALRNGRLPGYAKGGIVELGKRIQRMGYDVSEHPAFGGVAPGAHAANGWHYKAGALDINADPFNSKFKNEMAALDKLNAILRGEGWNTIWRAANHFDHLHVDIGNGQKGGLGGLGGGFLTGLAGKVAEKGSKALTSLLDKMPGADSFAGQMAISPMKLIASEVTKKVKSYADSMVDAGESSGGGASVEKWRGTVLKALDILGLSDRYANATLRRMMQESGGNSRAINNRDSNAAAGTPSKGLMQVIDPTFRAYAHPKYNRDVYDPLSNILASMRYAISRYGNLFNAYGRKGGYAVGTDSATAGWHMVGENGPELMRFRGGEQVYNREQTMRLADMASRGGGGGGIGAVYVQNPWTGEYHEAQMQRIVDENADFNESVGRMG